MITTYANRAMTARLIDHAADLIAPPPNDVLTVDLGRARLRDASRRTREALQALHADTARLVIMTPARDDDLDDWADAALAAIRDRGVKVRAVSKLFASGLIEVEIAR